MRPLFEGFSNVSRHLSATQVLLDGIKKLLQGQRVVEGDRERVGGRGAAASKVRLQPPQELVREQPKPFKSVGLDAIFAVIFGGEDSGVKTAVILQRQGGGTARAAQAFGNLRGTCKAGVNEGQGEGKRRPSLDKKMVDAMDTQGGVRPASAPSSMSSKSA